MSGCWRTLQNLKKCSAEFCETSWLFPGVPGCKHLTKCISKPGVHCYSSFWGHWLLFRFIQGIPVSKCTSTGYCPTERKVPALAPKILVHQKIHQGKFLRATPGASLSQYFTFLDMGQSRQKSKAAGKEVWVPVSSWHFSFLLKLSMTEPCVTEHRRAGLVPDSTACAVWGSQNFFFFFIIFFFWHSPKYGN